MVYTHPMRSMIPIALLSATLFVACSPGVDPYRLDGADAETQDGNAGADPDPADGDPTNDDEADGGDFGSGDSGGDLGGDQDPVSVCEWTELSVRCPHETSLIDTGYPGLSQRQVHWQVPLGTAPAEGFPAVIFFQGSLFSSQYAWEGVAGEVFGALYQARSLGALLDAGFAVIAPEAHLQGSTFWDTNLPAWAANWEAAPDHALMQSLFSEIEAGAFGPIDGAKLFGLGISSGGYMTSRLAEAYPGRFVALAIHSGSWATCAATICVLPADLPVDHPPTLFLHGLTDPVVPEWTMRLYEERLRQDSVPTRIVEDALVGHQWLPQAPESIPPWFTDQL